MHAFSHDETYPFSQTEQEIAEIHFKTDDILKDDPKTQMPVCGLNLTCAWHLPSHLKENYNILKKGLEGLDKRKGRFYIYPFEQTHITIATLINFKKHKEPSADDEKEIMGMVPKIIKKLKSFIFDEAANEIKPFTMELGPLELSPKAGIILIKNPDGEIARLRSRLKTLINNKTSFGDSYIQDRIKAEFNCPNIIHSTILRFNRDFSGGPDFAKKFVCIRPMSQLGQATIYAISLTAETNPYMHQGTVCHTFSLRK